MLVKYPRKYNLPISNPIFLQKNGQSWPYFLTMISGQQISDG